MTKAGGASEHYLGERGREYAKGFDALELGRIYQTHYFRNHCTENRVLLDFGCADGLFLRSLPARARIGVEANPAVRKQCIELSRQASRPIELHENLSTVTNESVDVVISNHSLEHVLNPLHEIREVERVLKPAGLLLIVVPFDDWRSKRHRTWSTGDPDHHLFTWSPLNLGNLVSEAGLKVQHCSVHTAAWSPKFFWIHRFFGVCMFALACYLFGLLTNRREVFCRAVKGA